MLDTVEVNTIIGKDGRITIPIKVREVMQLGEGDVIKFVANSEGECFFILVSK